MVGGVESEDFWYGGWVALKVRICGVVGGVESVGLWVEMLWVEIEVEGLGVVVCGLEVVGGVGSLWVELGSKRCGKDGEDGCGGCGCGLENGD